MTICYSLLCCWDTKYYSNLLLIEDTQYFEGVKVLHRNVFIRHFNKNRSSWREILLLWESNLNFFYPLKHVNHISWLVSTGKCSLSQMSYKIDGLKKFTKLSLFKKRYRDTSFPVIFQAYLFNRTSSDDCFCSNASYYLMETFTSSWNIFDKVSYFTVVKQLRDFTSDLVRILELFTVAAAGGVLWKKLFLKLTGKHLCEGWRPPTIFKEDSSKVFFLWTLRNF